MDEVGQSQRTAEVDGKTFVVRGHEHTYDCLQLVARSRFGPWYAYCLVDRVDVPGWKAQA